RRAPDGTHGLEILDGAGALVIERNAERVELRLQVPDAEAEDESSAGDHVDARQFLGEHQRIALRPDDDRGAEAAPLRVRSDQRTDAFDKILAATHDHFWDPTDQAYLDFAEPFDITADTLLPRSMIIELNCAVVDKLDERQQIRIANESTHFTLSSILHGEQG